MPDLTDLSPGAVILAQLVLLPVVTVVAALLARRAPARAHAIIIAGLLATLAAPLLTLASARLGLGLLPGLELVVAGAGRAGADVGGDASARSAISATTVGLAAWALVSAALALRLATGLTRGVRIARAADPCTDADALAALARAVRRAGGARSAEDMRRRRDAADGRGSEAACNAPRLRRLQRVRLCRTPALESPAIFCWGRVARILLPATLAPDLGPDDDARTFDQLLAHELAHLDRRDHWWRLIAEASLCALPWHPAVWWLRRHVYETSEMACDARVVRGDAQPERYAETLLRLTPCRTVQLPALHAVRARTSLTRRIRAILHHGSARDRSGRAWLAAITIGAAVTASAAALAQPRPPAIILPGTPPGAPTPTFAVQAVPTEVDLGTVAPGGTAEGRVRLVNVGSHPVHYTDNKASCGCTMLEKIDPHVLEPGAVLTIPITLDAPDTPDTERRRKITILFEELEPLEVFIRLTTTG